MLQLIDSFEALAAIESGWRDLCDCCPRATVFQRPEWLLPWWKHLGGGQIRALASSDNGRLRGLAPLFLHGMPGREVRQISFIGAGITDYLDFIAQPGFETEFTAAVRDWLNSHGSEWDIVNLEELRPNAVALSLADSERCSTCAVLKLPPCAGQWESSLDKTHRRNVRHARSQGEFRYELSLDASYFSDFIRLHEISWRDRNQPGVLSTPELQAFYSAAARCLAASHLLRMHLLWRGRTLAGVIFGMEYNGCGYAYLGGFDPEFRKHSPGTVLMWYAITNAISSALREWDLLRGAESYKYLWGAKNRENHKILMAHGSPAYGCGNMNV